MKKRLNDIFSVSRNERIALICIIIIIAMILTYKAFSPPTEKIEKAPAFQTEQDFLSATDSAKTDTLPAKNKKKRKPKGSAINTVSSLKPTATFLISKTYKNAHSYDRKNAICNKNGSYSRICRFGSRTWKYLEISV